MHYISFDSHKKYTLASVERASAPGIIEEARIEHDRGALREFLSRFDPGSPVAVETIGNWYWIVDEVETAGMKARLVHARKAKLLNGNANKTDKLDARGMNKQQRNGILPIVWIPPGDLRDKRELTRARMALSAERTRLKNRLHATLAKYALSPKGVSDIFGPRSRKQLLGQVAQLPEHTRYASELFLNQLKVVQEQIDSFEERMKAVLGPTRELELVKTMPGIGFILGSVVLLEVGDVDRFPSAEHLASYAGTTPRVHASGGKTRYGQLRSDVNRYLKWAFIEAANTVSLNRRRWGARHVTRLYERIRSRKGHPKAIGAVARHLAEATYWILSKEESYREPQVRVRPRRR